MKRKTIYHILVLALLATGVAGCDNTDYSNKPPFDNSVYLNGALTKDVTNVTFKRTLTEVPKEFTAMLAYPATQDVEVSISVDPSLAAGYNARLGTDYATLDPKHYKLSGTTALIPAGEAESKPVTITFTGLEELPLDVAYLAPVTVSNVQGGVETLDGSKTICYVVKKSSAITAAANLRDNYMEVPGFDAGSPTADVVNGMKALTYEAIIWMNSFDYGAIGDKPVEISSIMGIEQYILLRIGDANFPRQQLQFAGPRYEWKFPKADKSKSLQPKTWYHVAFTWDLAAQTTIFYVDGQEQSRNEEFANNSVTEINLGKQVRGEHFMFKIGHSYGEPEDYDRQLDGNICECRVWNVARTQQEIYENMYDIDPKTPGLCAYWKFNEEKGDVVKDQTGNGNDARAHNSPLAWPTGIEVPKKNETN